MALLRLDVDVSAAYGLMFWCLQISGNLSKKSKLMPIHNQTPVLCHVAICMPIGYNLCILVVLPLFFSTNPQRQDWSIRSAFMNGYIPRTNLIPLYGALAASPERLEGEQRITTHLKHLKLLDVGSSYHFELQTHRLLWAPQDMLVNYALNWFLAAKGRDHEKHVSSSFAYIAFHHCQTFFENHVFFSFQNASILGTHQRTWDINWR